MRVWKVGGFVLLIAPILMLGPAPGRSATEAPAMRPVAEEYSAHHDHILGTSLDLVILAERESDAFAAEDAVLAEIERLRLVFSLYDPASELSRMNRTRAAVPASGDLLAVLRLYEVWQERSGGAFNGQLGDLVALWKLAEKQNRLPDAATLEALVREAGKPAWRIDSERRTVQKLTSQNLNLNAIAKGYIVQRAAEAGRRTGARGILVNLGGDIRVLGETPIAVGIQDPFHPEDNAAPLAAVKLHAGAVATSGGYQRFVTIEGRRYSHILDPRTGRPVEGVASATVVAKDNATANALATTLCVLSPDEGLKLVAGVPGAECLVIASDGTRFASPGLNLLEVERAVALQEKKDEKKGDPWPADYQVKLQIELPTIENTKSTAGRTWPCGSRARTARPCGRSVSGATPRST